MENKTYFNWSSGKDSMLALHYLKAEGKITVDRLITTVNKKYDRVSMHGLRRSLLEAQASALGFSLDVIDLPESPTMDDYNLIMKTKINELVDLGFTQTVFGDIFLEDLRKYREDLLAPYGIKALFPLWNIPTNKLIEELISLGYKTKIICVDHSKLDDSFLGKTMDLELVKRLPSDVDPCGENGEFHTFCYDGPLFKTPLEIEVGEITHRSYPAINKDEQPKSFGWCDLNLKGV